MTADPVDRSGSRADGEDGFGGADSLAHAGIGLAELASSLRTLEVGAALDELESEMTHALKNPLAGMVLSSTRIRRSVAAVPGQERLATICAHLCDAVAKLNEAIARFDGLELMPGPSPRETDVRSLLDAPMALLEEERGVAVFPRLPADLPRVQVDPSFARAALANLLEQAAVGCGKGEVVEVTVRQAEDGRVHIDIGHGISPVDRDGDQELLRPLRCGRLDRLGVGIARRLLEASGCGLVVLEEDGRLRARVSIATAHVARRREGA